MLFWIVLVVFTVSTYVLKRLFFPDHQFETVSGAVIMAMGIVLNGALSELSIFPEWVLSGLTLFISSIWFLFFIDIIQSLRTKQFQARFFQHSLQTFALGTWIAGTSMFLLSMISYFPEQIQFVKVIDGLNLILWLIYLGLITQTLKKIRITCLNGLILLVTVSTQSTVIMNHVLYGDHVPAFIYQTLIWLGILFYVAGMGILLYRYLPLRKWNIASDWVNPNCIIHGAASITGLAMAMTGVFASSVLTFVWVWSFTLFIIVELIEIVRAITRVKRFGWVKGIGTYHVSQWARNFTFGMFFMFGLQAKEAVTANPVLTDIFTVSMNILPWLVLLLFINECMLFTKANFRMPERRKIHHQTTKEISS